MRITLARFLMVALLLTGLGSVSFGAKTTKKTTNKKKPTASKTKSKSARSAKNTKSKKPTESTQVAKTSKSTPSKKSTEPAKEEKPVEATDATPVAPPAEGTETAKATTSKKSSRGAKKTPPKKEAPLNKTEIKEAEQRLADLGYWTGRVDGTFDEASRHALVAFQKVTGRKLTGRMTRGERAALMRAERPEPKNRGDAHIEVDLDRQVLFMVDADGVVNHILPVSTGSGEEFKAEGYWRTAITPSGHLSVLKKIKGWKKSALGELYYPNYIVGGIAIHGHTSVPFKPASHGCIRIPMFAAKEFFAIVPIGMDVFVLFDPKLETPEIPTETPKQVR